MQEENPNLLVMLAQNLVSATQSQDWAREMLLSFRSRRSAEGTGSGVPCTRRWREAGMRCAGLFGLLSLRGKPEC